MRVGGPGPQSERLSLYQGPAETTEKVVLCYFANWAGIREGDGIFVPENIQVEKSLQKNMLIVDQFLFSKIGFLRTKFCPLNLAAYV